MKLQWASFAVWLPPLPWLTLERSTLLPFLDPGEKAGAGFTTAQGIPNPDAKHLEDNTETSAEETQSWQSRSSSPTGHGTAMPQRHTGNLDGSGFISSLLSALFNPGCALILSPVYV